MASDCIGDDPDIVDCLSGQRKILLALFVVSATLFTACLIIGYSTTDVTESEQAEYNGELVEPKSPMFFITTNGLVLLLIVSGFFLFGIPTFVNLSVNGLLLGDLIAAANASGLSLTEIVLLVAPHAIFEFTAFFIGGAVGFVGPIQTIQYLRGRSDHFLTKEQLKINVVVVLMAFTFIIIGAFVESWITPWVYEMY